MTTVSDILKFIHTLAPPALAESWDNCGLLCGRGSREVRRVLVALDPFRNVIAEAIEKECDLIVTHHPLIFGETVTAVNEDTETGRCLLELTEHGIAAINAHTNLDLAPGGINDVLAATLGLTDIQTVDPVGDPPIGLLRCGNVPEQALPAFLAHVKQTLGCDGLRYADGGKPVRKVAVGGGSCGSELERAIAAGCDTFVTADIKYNQFRTAYEKGLNLIDAGHFHTENPAMPVLARRIQEAFPEITVIFSENHRDCMKFY